MEAQVLTCPKCGKTQDIPANSRAKIFCPACDTELILPPGLQKNNEIAAKDNINSAIPLQTTFTDMQKALARTVAEDPTLPLDLLSRTTVTKERRICVSSYLFQCSANVTYNCEAGNEREYQKIVKHGDGAAIEEGTRIEWSQMSSACSFNADVFCSGNKEMSDVISTAYANETTNSLEDIEEVSYDSDVETYGFDLIQSNAFNNVAKPKVEGMAVREVEKSLTGRTVRNISIGSCFINKDMVRVFLPVLILDCKYANDREYALYSSGTGTLAEHAMPVDPDRKSRFDEYNKTIADGDGSPVLPFIVAAGLLALAIWWGWYWMLGIPAAIAAIMGFWSVNKHNQFTSAKEALKVMRNESIAAANEFLRKGVPLGGVVYDNDKGDIFGGYQIPEVTE